MKQKLSWTVRQEDRVKQETRVEISRGNIKWQFKRADEDRWDYDRVPSVSDWDKLEEEISRRVARGKGLQLQEAVKAIRLKTRV